MVFLQPKLEISEPGDPLEREAGRVEELVTGAWPPGGSEEVEGNVVSGRATVPTAQRDCAVCASGAPCPDCAEEERAQLKHDPGADAVVEGACDGFIRDMGPGRPLDSATRALMEPLFGFDFGRVRVHSDHRAAESARAVGAQAYTVGHHIAFASGRFAPTTTEGKRLMAHELAHVVQQGRAEAPLARDQGLARESSGPVRSAETERTAPRPRSGPRPRVSLSPAHPSRLYRQSVNQQAESALGVAPGTISGKSVKVEATIAAGQTLPGSDADRTIHTLKATQVTITAGYGLLMIHFYPDLVITKHFKEWYKPDTDIGVTEVTFNLKTGIIDYTYTSPNYAEWLGNPSGELGEGFKTIFGHIPADMRKPGYDPFADPDLTSKLSTIASAFSSGGGAPAKVPTVSGINLQATATINTEIRKGEGRLSLAIPAGTDVEINVALEGGVPEKLSDIKVSSIRINLTSPKAGPTVDLRIYNVNFPLIFLKSVVFSKGGALSFNYDLATEVVEAGFLSLLAKAAQESGVQVGEGVSYRDPRIRALIDDAIRKNLEPLLRDLVRANRKVIPGIDLYAALGYHDPTEKP
jgi:hypothetical protein